MRLSLLLFASLSAIAVSGCTALSQATSTASDVLLMRDVVRATQGAVNARQVNINETTFRDVTTRLASDEFEGRAPGTAGEEKTVNLLIERFRALGLQPGNNGSWTQTVPLVEVTASN